MAMSSGWITGALKSSGREHLVCQTIKHQMATSENEVEILRIVRSIRDSVGLLPDKVADQVADRLKSGVAAPAQISKPEPVKEEAPEAPTIVETSEEFASVQV